MKNKKNIPIFKEKRFLSAFVVGMVFVLAILVDQLTKGLIIPAFIPKVGDSMKVLPNIINFIYVKNFGAAWGIFKNNTIFLIIVTILGIALIATFYVVRMVKMGNRVSILFAVSTGMMLGGAVGNLADRLIFGYVRDFINFEFFNFPVFNFADTFLTIGIILLIIYILFFYNKEMKEMEVEGQNNTKKNGAEISEPVEFENKIQDENKENKETEENKENKETEENKENKEKEKKRDKDRKRINLNDTICLVDTDDETDQGEQNG